MEIKKMGHPPSIKLGDDTNLLEKYASKRSVKSLKKASKIELAYKSFNLKSHLISAVDQIPRGIVAHVQKRTFCLDVIFFQYLG